MFVVEDMHINPKCNNRNERTKEFPTTVENISLISTIFLNSPHAYSCILTVCNKRKYRIGSVTILLCTIGVLGHSIPVAYILLQILPVHTLQHGAQSHETVDMIFFCYIFPTEY